MIPLFLPMLFLSPHSAEDEFMVQLFTKYHGLMFAAAYQRLQRPELADEAVSLACTRLIPQITTLMPLEEGQLKVYVYRTAVSCAIDLVRTEQRQRAHAASLDAVEDWEIADEAAAARTSMEARTSRLADALERLSESDQDVIRLFYFDGYSQKEIAERLGIQPVSVASRLSRARSRLRGILPRRDRPKERRDRPMKPVCSTDEFQDRCEQALMEAALTELERRELARLEAAMQEPQMQAEIAASRARIAEATIRQIRQRFSRQRCQIHRRTFSRMALRTAAVIGALCILGTGTLSAALANDALRSKVFRFIQEQSDGRIRLYMLPDADSTSAPASEEDSLFIVPNEWTGDYYPSRVPAGFRIRTISEFFANVAYESPDGGGFLFHEYTPGDSVEITRNARTTRREINGYDCLICEFDDGTLNVSWPVEDRFFTLDAWRMSKDDVCDIVAGIRKIR